MSKNYSNNYHPNFINYIHEIIQHPNYTGLPIRFNDEGFPIWLAPKKSKTDDTGIKREEWADQRAIELQFQDSSKKYADTMFSLHPTKKKVCQWCGKTMDLHYIYPTKNTIKYFERNFEYTFNKYDSIYDIVYLLPQFENEIKKYLIAKACLSDKYNSSSITEIIIKTEHICRMEGKSIFSPGAMSNFPDRFDGFHSYNLCCRKTKDKGRHDDNMASYNRDRRAYEYWVDGNIAAANQLMRDSTIFGDMSADHIGPISLGFIHDPIYLQPMISRDNSAKRDRLGDDDMQKLISLENQTGISPSSHFAEIVWSYIKKDYLSDNRIFDLSWYRDALKQNMVNFMESIWILLNTSKREHVEEFFTELYFKPKYDKYFKYKYEFNVNGTIKKQHPRNITNSAKEELSRLVRISFESVENFHSKSNENRNNSPELYEEELHQLASLQNYIINKTYPQETLNFIWNNYLNMMQSAFLANWTE